VVAELSESPNASASSLGPKYSETAANANNRVVANGNGNGNGKHDSEEETLPVAAGSEGGKEATPTNGASAATDDERINGSSPGPKSHPQRNGRQSPAEKSRNEDMSLQKGKMASSEQKESGGFY